MEMWAKASFVRIVVAALFVLAALSGRVMAQQPNAPASSAVPPIIQFTGTLGGGSVSVPAGTVSVTFTLYEAEQGGTALWSETQNVQVDAQGHYTALLGSTSPEGLPLSLFTGGQAHWLAVQPLLQGVAEEPRVMLVGVPYAMKAADADTLGGLPASAFIQAAPLAATGSGLGDTGTAVNVLAGTGSAGSTAKATSKGSHLPPAICTPVAGALTYWDADGSLCPSQVIQETGMAFGRSLGVNQSSPVHPQLDTILVTGNLTGTGTVTGTVVSATTSFNLAGVPFAYGSSTLENAFLGFAGNFTTTGIANTATGTAALESNTTGGSNTASGYAALEFNTTGNNNTATGAAALGNNTTGGANTAIGINALNANISGSSNTASGVGALQDNTTGSSNTASGFGALQDNTTGNANTADGIYALNANTTGVSNTAIGTTALYINSTGSSNTAIGAGALQNNTTGIENTANGEGALGANTTGGFNTATGDQALFSNTTGSPNTTMGYAALYSNVSGSDNVASGWLSLYSNVTGTFNTAVGDQSLYSNVGGTNNIGIGYETDFFTQNGNNNIWIGNMGSTNDNGHIYIGTEGTQTATVIAGIYQEATNGSNNPLVCIDSTGTLGTTNCATSGLASSQGDVISRQQEQIQTLQKQNEEFQQRLARLESLISKK